MTAIRQVNPKVRIIITLSPVRHYPGDLVLNARSKANILAAIHEIADAHPDCCTYFPAYEIVHDELRDYRFFAADMLHPGELAERIVFERFSAAFFDADARKFMVESENRLKAAQHRPLHVD